MGYLVNPKNAIGKFVHSLGVLTRCKVVIARNKMTKQSTSIGIASPAARNDSTIILFC